VVINDQISTLGHHIDILPIVLTQGVGVIYESMSLFVACDTALGSPR